MAYIASKAQSGLGTLLQVNATVASPPVWTTIGEVIDIDMSPKNMFDDTTNLQSLAKEFLATLPDPGKLTCTMNRVGSDAGQQFMWTNFEGRVRDPFQLVLPLNPNTGQSSVGDTYSFLAYVEAFQPSIKADKKIVSKLDLQITGAINLAYGS